MTWIDITHNLLQQLSIFCYRTGVVLQRLLQRLPLPHRRQVIHVTSHQLWGRIAKNRWLALRQQCVCSTFYGKWTFAHYYQHTIELISQHFCETKKPLGIEAFSRFWTRCCIAFTNHCIFGWHHLQSKFIAWRAPSSIAASSSVVPRRHWEQPNAFGEIIDSAEG